MKKKVKYYKGFSLVEMLLVIGIFIILSVIGFNGFLSIRESFIARENVELIIQDIESTKLKAMNMEGGRDATWIYGFGIDLTQAHLLNQTGDYEFFKWCSPVVDYGVNFLTYGDVTQNILPNLASPSPIFDNLISNYPLCDANANYHNGRIPTKYYNGGNCVTNRTCLLNVNEISTLIDREADQMEVLNITPTVFPAYLFFESLTGRAIIYNNGGEALGYHLDALNEVVFDQDQLVPLDIVLYRKRSNKFDLITVYPNSGEVIHHVYDNNDPVPNITFCNSSLINCINVGGRSYQRYGIREEISSFRD